MSTRGERSLSVAIEYEINTRIWKVPPEQAAQLAQQGQDIINHLKTHKLPHWLGKKDRKSNPRG